MFFLVYLLLILKFCTFFEFALFFINESSSRVRRGIKCVIFFGAWAGFELDHVFSKCVWAWVCVIEWDSVCICVNVSVCSKRCLCNRVWESVYVCKCLFVRVIECGANVCVCSYMMSVHVRKCACECDSETVRVFA